MSENGQKSYREITDRAIVSTRTYDRLAKVARTVADLADSDLIESEHIEEAARFVSAGILQK
jgi:magnesium chelatase family protein